jgi:hypothetical protein
MISEPELVALDDLTPHPRNYRKHPADQIAHLAQSMREHGFYRNVVVARDGTILAGHGVAEAAREAGLTEVPVVRLPIAPDDPRAIKLLVADNEVGHLAEQDDRALTELLKQISEKDAGLIGTGYDEAMLANLLYVTRPRDEIQDFDAAAHWAGLPEYFANEKPFTVVVSCETEQEREQFIEHLGAVVVYKKGRTYSIRWPLVAAREDPASLSFETR